MRFITGWSPAVVVLIAILLLLIVPPFYFLIKTSLYTTNPDGSFGDPPDNGFSGSDGFTYVATDGEAESNIATVLIGVTLIRRRSAASMVRSVSP